MPSQISGFREIADRYDLLVCDIWGVVHNGVRAWPLACDALEVFRSEGGTVVLVTNAPRPHYAVAGQLKGFSVPDSAYDAIVTSGDLSRIALERCKGNAVYHLGPERDQGVFAGLDVKLSSPEEADIVLNTGLFDDDTETPEDYADLIKRLRARNLPMICANPDIVVERGKRLVYCAGAIAQVYEDVGGKVLWTGKPRPPIYEHAFRKGKEHRRDEVAADRALAIGDSFRTDIAGGKGYGMETLLVANGIHGADLMPEGKLDMAAVERLGKNADAAPDHAIETFRWDPLPD